MKRSLPTLKKIYGFLIVMVPLLVGHSNNGFAQAVGDYGTRYNTGTATAWGTATNWVVCVTAGTWTGATTASAVPNNTKNVWIRSGANYTMNGNAGACNNMVVNGTANWTQSRTTNVSGNLIISGGILAGTTGTLNVTGDFSVPASTTANIRGINLTVTGATSINGTIDFVTSVNGTKTFTGLVTIASTGIWNNTIGEGAYLGGGMTNNGTFNSGNGIFIFSTNSQSLNGTSNITFNANTTIQGAITVTNNITVTFVGTVSATVAGGAFVNAANSTLNINNAFLSGNGTLTATATGNTVNYQGTVTQTVKAPVGGAYYNLVLQSSGAKTLTTGTTAINGDFTMSGSATATGVVGLTIGGDVILDGGTFTNGTFTHNVAGNWFDNGGTFTPGSGTVNFNGSSAQSVGGTSSTTFNVLEINNAAGVTLGRATTASTLTIGDVTSNSIFDDGGFGLTSTGTLNLTSGTYKLGSASAATTFPAFATRNITAGTTVEYRAGVAQTVSTTPSYSNLVFSGAGTKTTATGTLTIEGDWTVGSTTALNTNNTVVSLTGNLVETANLTQGTGAMTIGGNLTLTSGILTAGNSISIDGNWTKNGGTFTPGSGTVTFTGNSSAINGTAASQTFNNIIVNKTAGQTLSVGGSTATLNVGGTFTETTGNFSAPATMSVTGAVTLTAGTFTAGANLNTSGDWTNNGGTFTPGSGTVTFNNTSAGQTINGSATSQTFNNLTVAKSSATLTIGGSTANAIVSGTLTMTSGNIDCGANTLVLGTSISTLGTLAYTSGNIIGNFKRWIGGAGSLNFPVGTAAYNRNALVTFPGDVTGTLTGKFIASDPGSTGLPLTDNTHAVENQFTEGYWSLVSGDGLSGTASYNLELTGTNFTSYTEDANVRIIKRPSGGGSWTLDGTHVPGSAPTAKRATLTGFSEFAHGKARPLPTVTFTSASQSSANESGTMTVTAQLSATSPVNVTVPFTVTGTATGGTDYTITASPITITAGNMTGTATITITSDALDEPNETVILTMGAPTNAAQGATTVHTATITDDDATPTVSFTTASQSSANESGTMTIAVQLSAASGQTVTVPFTVTGSATGSGTDYTITASPITITAGTTTANITITIATDAITEGNETVIVTMGSPTNATQGATTVHTATITDDDSPGITVTPTSGLTTTEAGGQATFTVKLNTQPTASVTIGISSSNTAEGTVSPGSLTFTTANWGTTQTVTITGVDDGTTDDGDIAYTIFTAAATSSDVTYNGMNPSDVLVTNIDNDGAPAGSIAVNRAAPQNTYTPQELVENVLVQGCLTASNISFTGNSAQIGHFTNGTSSFPITEGILLSTGNVVDAEGPNYDYNTTTQFGGAGDSQLNTAAGLSSSNDAAVLEFDFVPAGNTIEFDYIFASEEYAEYVGEQYNDAFAFFLSGPGITGAVNIALIPSTSTPVAINNVHGQGATLVSTYSSQLQALMTYPSAWGHTYTGGTYGPWTINPTNNSSQPPLNSSYYVDNGHFTNRTDGTLTWTNGNGGAESEFDGRTTVLTASHSVTACQTYHIKIVVADAVDQKWDSGVFLEGRSFTSNEVQISSQLTGIEGDASDMYEGCEGSFIRFQRAVGADNSVVLNFPILISGTATNGVDFVYTDSGGNVIGDGTFPTTATLAAGVNYIDYYYKAQSDGSVEGNETVVFRVNNGCPCDPEPTYYTKTVTIIDTPQVPTSEVTVVFCNNGSNPLATITVVLPEGLDPSNYKFALIPNGDPDPIFSAYQEGNQFQIVSTMPDGSDIVGDLYDIFVSDDYGCQTRAVRNVVIPELSAFDVNAGADISMCEAQTGVQLNGSGSIYYTWTCLPANGVDYLSSTTVQNPTVNSGIPVGTYTFTLHGQDVPGGSPTCSGTDEMVLTVKTKPVVTSVTAASYSMCNAGSVQLTVSATNAGSNPTYSWNPSANLNNATIYNPVYTPSVSSYLGQSFSVTVTADNGCTASGSSSTVEIFPSPEITTGTIVNATCGASTGSATVSASSPGTSPQPSFNYLWDAAAGNQTTATATNLAAGTYTVTVTDATHGCSNTKQVTVGSASDSTPPTAVCQDITVTLVGGTATITPVQINDGSSDNCTAQGSLVLSLDKTTFTTSDIGANTVTLTVKDAANNTSTCTATVTVIFPADCSVTGSRTIYQEQFEATAQYTIVGGGTAYSDAGTMMRVTQNTNSNNYFLSNVIDIRSWTNLIVKVSATANSGNLETADNIRAQYSYNNVDFTNFANNNPLGGNNNGTLCTNVPDGTNLYIKVLVLNSSTNEWREFDNVHLTGDPAMEATGAITNVSCNGGNNGAIDVTVTKGVAPYTYAWTTSNGSIPSGAADDQDLSGLIAGTYNLVVTDANSVASNTFPFIVTQPTADPTITTSLAVSDATACNPAGGNVTFTITNAQNGIHYELKNTGGASLSPAVTGTGTGSNLNLTLLQANVPTTTTTYKVVATSASGCSFADLTDQPILTVNTTPAPTGSDSQSFCSTSSPKVSNISVTGSGIIWYNAVSGGSVVAPTTNLVSGTTYYASQTVGGCESPARLAVTVTVYATPSILTVTHGDICGSGVTTLYATSSAGTINWYTASTGGSSVHSGTSYTLSTPISATTSFWVDATIGGCTTVTRSEVIARVNAIPGFTLGSNPVICFGATSASLTYSAVVGNPNRYSINFDGTAEGIGFVDVTDVTLPSSPITITVPGGAPVGTYNAVLKLKDVSTPAQCVSVDYPITITITQVAVSRVITDVSCVGLSNGAINVTPSGGTSPYTYAWTTSNGSGLNATAEDQTGLTAGTYNVTVTDAHNCQASGIYTVATTPDVTNPAIAFTNTKDDILIAITSSDVATNVSVNFTAFNDGSGARNVNPVPSDNCAVTKYIYAETGATTYNSPTTGINTIGTQNFNLDETVINWTASDAANNSAGKTQKVYAARENQFVLSCASDPDLGCNPSAFPKTNPTYTLPSWLQTLIGNSTLTLDTTMTTVLNAASGTECAVTRTRTYTVTFNIKYGGVTIATVVRTCTQTYTYIVDTTNPVASCTTNKTVNVDSGECNYTHSGTAWNATATDNCHVASLVYSLSGATSSGSGTSLNGVNFNAGVTTVTWTATDDCGNTHQCSYTVTVSENLSISVQPQNQTGCGSGTVSFSVTASGASGTPTYQWQENQGSGWGNITNSGIYSGATSSTLQLAGVTMGMNTWQYQVIVTGVCTVNTLTSNAASLTVNASPSTSLAVSDAAICKPASENITLTITNAENGVSYELKYLAGGSLSPAVTGTGTGSNLNLVILQANAPTVTTTYKVVATIAGCSSVDLTDQPVVTVDVINPTISSCPDNITVNVDAGLCSANVSWTAPTANDNCTIQSFTSNYSPGASFATGATTVIYTATDTNGNTATCSFTVTVNDNINPVISSCPANTTVSTLNDLPAAATTALAIGATDNCGISTVTHADVHSLSCPRTVTRTYTVTDINGNQTTCQQVITVTNAPCIDASLCTTATSTNLVTGSPSSGTGTLYTQSIAVCSSTTYEVKLTGVSGTSPFDFNVVLDGDVVNDNSMYNSGSTFGFKFKTGPSATSVSLSLVNNSANSLTVSAISFAHCGPTVSIALTTEPECAGALAEVTATVTGSGSYVYQWEESSNGGSSWSDVSGATSTVLSFTSWSETKIYRIVVSETSSGLNDTNCSIQSGTVSISPTDNSAPVYQEAFKNGIDPVHTGGNYTYTACDNGTNIFAFLSLDATDLVDNCSAFGDLIKTYSITNGINNKTNETGDASNYEFPIGTSTVTYQAEDENGNVGIFTFTVVVNENPVLTTITTDGTVSADGSGYKPYQGSQHTYTVDGGTATSGSTYTWKVLDKDNAELTADNANTYSINTSNPAAVVITWGGSIPVSGNNYKIVVKETNSSGCNTEAELSVVILENTFNVSVIDHGDECQTGFVGQSTATFSITKIGGSTHYSFRYVIKEGSTVVFPTDYGTNGPTTYDTQLDAGDSDLANEEFYYIVENEADVNKTYTFEIQNVVDQYNTPETNTGDNSDTIILKGVPAPNPIQVE